MQPPIRPELSHHKFWDIPDGLTVGALIEKLQEIPKEARTEIQEDECCGRSISAWIAIPVSEEDRIRHNKKVLQYQKDLLLYQEFSLQRQLENIRKIINATT